MQLIPCEHCGHAPNGHQAQVPPPSRKLEKYDPYIFDPLKSKSGSIRILNLRGSGVGTPEIDCELVNYSFRKTEPVERSYEALSWCWGQMKHDAKIFIRKGGKRYVKYVSPELFAALRALRHPTKDRFLWVDAICIDQANNDEKNHQVEMMSDIYGKANQVCVWLGEGDKSSRTAIKFIKKEVLKLQNFDELCANEENTEKWGALLDLMQRRWFSRRWLVQEIALARRAVIYCGADKISWKDFAVAVELFVEVETATHRLSEVMKKDPHFYHVPGWFEYVSALGASLLVEATGKLFRDYKPHRPQIRTGGQESDSEISSESEDTGSDNDRDTETDTDSQSSSVSNSQRAFLLRRGQPLLSLEYLVSSLSIFDTSVPHDSIYALLAIAKDTTPSADPEHVQHLLDHTQDVLEVFVQKKRYRVEYQRPFADVCKDFVQFCIGHSDPSRALDIICRPWAPRPKEQARNGSPPTRIPTERAAAKSTESRKKSKSRTKRKSAKTLQQPEATQGVVDEQKMTNAEQDQEKRKEQYDMPLPSWIPQLSGASFDMYSQPGAHTMKMGRKNADSLVGLPPSNQSLQRNYNAALTKAVDYKSLNFRKRPQSGHYSMYVRGFILDTVDDVQPSSQGGAIPREWAHAGGWEDVPVSDPPNDFWRTLVADRGREGRNPPVYYSSACRESFVKGGLTSGVVNTTDLIHNERNSVVAQFCRRVQAVIWNRSLITTKITRRLGLASQLVTRGNRVCILYGCSVPVILREREKSKADLDLEIIEDTEHRINEMKDRMRRNYKRNKMFKEKIANEKKEFEEWDSFMLGCWLDDEDWPEDRVGRRQMATNGENFSGIRSLGVPNGTMAGSRRPSRADPHRRAETLLGPSLAPSPSVFDDSSRSVTGPRHSSPSPPRVLDAQNQSGSPAGSPTSPTNRTTSTVQAPQLSTNPKGNADPTEHSQPCASSNTTAAGNMSTRSVERSIKRFEENQHDREDRHRRKDFEAWKKKKGVEAQQREGAPKRPNVNWHQFKLFLKYGRRWKTLVVLKREIAIWLARWGEAWATANDTRRIRWLLKSSSIPVRRAKYFLLAISVQYRRAGFKRIFLKQFLQLRGFFVGNPRSAVQDSKEYLAAYEDKVRGYLDRKSREKYVERPPPEPVPSGMPEPETLQAVEKYKANAKRIDEHNERVKDNSSYYEFLGECYIRGMMDGEAIRFQNDNTIRAQVFELR